MVVSRGNSGGEGGRVSEGGAEGKGEGGAVGRAGGMRQSL